jgi:hypothetical protein
VVLRLKNALIDDWVCLEEEEDDDGMGDFSSRVVLL